MHQDASNSLTRTRTRIITFHRLDPNSNPKLIIEDGKAHFQIHFEQKFLGKNSLDSLFVKVKALVLGL